MKIEIHLLQNFAPSCLNRDDTNTPKSCVFGGYPRARVSSQCWKRAVRSHFGTAHRTKRIQQELAKRLGDSADATKIRAFVEAQYSKFDGKRPDETAVLVFIGDAELEEAAACIREGTADRAAADRLRAARQAADVAMFGRMLAEKPQGNVDAACQVAHAISTHAVDLEDDFYTAVDDLAEESGEIGAGMMGTQGFNSACFYRYAVIDREILSHHLGKDAMEKTVAGFLRAFALAVPAAKQNSHAAQSLPSFGLLVARDHGTPVSLANAFCRPIKGSDLIGESIRALCDYQACMGRVYGLYTDATLAVFHDRGEAAARGNLGHLIAADRGTLDGAIAAVMERINQ
jgi:CRISPR system Cascade subunit CasC